MKKYNIILSLFFSVVCLSLDAAPLAAVLDTLNQYVIDNKPVERFDGSQLEGKKIVSYRISTIDSAPEGIIRIHDILTKGAARSTDPVYVIDGKQVTKRRFESLSPSAIQSITVVKNGSQKEVRQYPGWENGVILVETKKEAPQVDTKDTQVNIGYGVADSHDFPYSVASVKPEDKNFYTNMYEYLRGKVAGVQIGPNNRIIIRGVTTLNSSTDPLILVDGVECTDLNLINPQDVYSVDVLKDASTAIYGLRGANGVILITTKKGPKAGNQDNSQFKED